MPDSTIEIRRLGVGDAALWLAAVETIISSADREGRLLSAAEADTALADDRCYLLTVTEESHPIGLLNAYRFPDAEAGGSLVYLYDIEVLQVCRGRGLGRGLLEYFIELCEKDGVKLVWAGTETSNTAARGAFEATEAEMDSDSYVEYEWDLED